MVYVRGQPGDFDDWRDAGNPGWSYAEVLPWFRKLEDHAWGASEFHGAGGPVHVSDVSASVHPLCGIFLEACSDARHRPHAPTSTARTREGAGLWQVTIKDGVRVSSRQRLPAPGDAAARNLEVRLRAHATRMCSAGARASGVEYLRGGTRQVAHARREVLLCRRRRSTRRNCSSCRASARRERLQRFGIPVIADSPAVGRGPAGSPGGVVFLPLARADAERAARAAARQDARGAALCARAPRPARHERQPGGRLRAQPPAAHAPQPAHLLQPRQLQHHHRQGRSRRLLNPDPYPGFLMSFNTCRPTSRGSIHIRSPDPLASPAIVPNSLATAADVQDVYDGARVVRAHRRRRTARRGVSRASASRAQRCSPTRRCSRIFARARARCSTPAAPAPMGADPRRAVLDARLRVRGVAGLARGGCVGLSERHLRQHATRRPSCWPRRPPTSFCKTVARRRR